MSGDGGGGRGPRPAWASRAASGDRLGRPPGPADLAPRAGLLGLGAVALLAGLTGALVLLGVPMPVQAAGFATGHGPLMTLGFLGTLIALERAVAMGRDWAYLAPLEAALGGLLLVAGQPHAVAGVAFAAGAAFLVLIYAAVDRVEPSLHGRVQAAGAVCWLAGAGMLAAGRPVPAVTPWLAAFLVLTVAGERLELSRIVRRGPAIRRTFVVVAGLFAAGVVATIAAPDAGLRVAGAGLVGLAAWLGRNDLARRTVRATGVTRYIAVCLLAGYAWMAVAGTGWLAVGSAAAGPGYDAPLHALFLGFVISMVFGHAPVILPAVLRLSFPYHPALYLPLVLLHGSLVLRIAGGDVLGSSAAWVVGGVLNAVALLAFLGIAVVMVAAARARRPAARGTIPA